MAVGTKREDQMARSLVRAARARGLAGAEIDLMGRAYRLAMEPRAAQLADDHHPAFLHPGRSALIVLQDSDSVSGEGLALAAVLESQDVALRLPFELVELTLGTTMGEALHLIPPPGAERLLERLIELDEGAALAALAERLDHLRHLHLRPERTASWPDQLQEVTRVWQPFASRVAPRLATRFAHWSRTFDRRIR